MTVRRARALLDEHTAVRGPPGTGWDLHSAEQAEARLLAWIDNDFEDDLRGAMATAAEESVPGVWRVTLRVTGEF
ncbi:hypothetical protein NMK44_16920 [Streptomyces sp. NEAU-Y11]|nr:hypothetical protein [Streptomyces sp. NEAU-Y11]